MGDVLVKREAVGLNGLDVSGCGEGLRLRKRVELGVLTDEDGIGLGYVGLFLNVFAIEECRDNEGDAPEGCIEIVHGVLP